MKEPLFLESRIRNFCIIAHIDHGKSTLADRLLEMTGTMTQRQMREQVLDSLDLERERGITIKAQAVRLFHRGKDGQVYQLNLIDTPGHVDFTYEVSRSLAACEGALLIVDATQGVEAQTLANVYLALENDLEIIPVINKIDLPASDVDEARRQITESVGLDGDSAFTVSAKTGFGCEELLQGIIDRIPPPTIEVTTPLRALIFDAVYDNFRGVICYVRVRDGAIKKGDKIRFMRLGHDFEVTELGILTPAQVPMDELNCGEVGYVIAGIRTLEDVRVGDTITHAKRPAEKALPGYKEAMPVVFAGLYPVNADDYDGLKAAIEKLRLNDAAFHVEVETSDALGFGFRCGFLGLLHMEIIQERLEREHNQNLLYTAPSVVYRVTMTNGDVIKVDNPSKLPAPQVIDLIEEPYVDARIFFPKEFVGQVLSLCQGKKGIQREMSFISPERVMVHYEFPLSEILSDFHDKLKSATSGYASFDYELSDYREGKMVKMDILVNGEPVDALSVIVHREDSAYKGRLLCKKLKEIVPRQMYAVAIQAAIGGKVIARETVSALRKDVTAKCYGGDISRKRKLLEKQKEGKKRMKQFGKIEIPQDAFMAVLRLSDD
ncbi:MAG: elongation factor 4 [Candidatus Sumerlaeia bacterium]|nr:elongation factor 4 [Candidatus Sumerlaeia bacterium]